MTNSAVYISLAVIALIALPVSVAVPEEALKNIGEIQLPDIMSNFGPDSRAVAYGDYVFIADSNGGKGSDAIRIFEVSNRYNPNEDLSFNFGKKPPEFLEPVDISRVNKDLYVLDKKRGVFKFNLSEILQKGVKRKKLDYQTVSVSGESNKFAIGGAYVFVAARNAGIYILGVQDFGDDTKQVILNYQSEDLGNAYSLALKGNHLFVLDKSDKELQIYDVSGLGNYNAQTINELKPVSTYKINKLLKNQADLTRVIEIDGDYMYLGLTDDLTLNKVRVFDISDINNVVAIGEFVPKDVYKNKRLPAGEVHDIKITGKYAYISTSSGLFLVDVSDPKNPKKLSHFYETPGFEEGSCVAMWGGYSFVATGSRLYSFVSPMAEEEQTEYAPVIISQGPQQSLEELPTAEPIARPQAQPSQTADQPTGQPAQTPEEEEERPLETTEEIPPYEAPVSSGAEEGKLFGLPYLMVSAIIVVAGVSAFFVVYELGARKAQKSPVKKLHN